MQVHALVDRGFPKIPVFSDEETSMICSEILASEYELAGDRIRQEQPREYIFLLQILCSIVGACNDNL